MMEMLAGVAVGMVLAGGALLALRLAWRRGAPGAAAGPALRVAASIEQIRSVGELVAFKVVTKEVVTAVDHWFGEVGKKYFTWLVSSKKMVMIFEFEIDFRYDLRGREFRIEDLGGGAYRLRMPPCFYQTHINSVSFYDEKRAEFLPIIVPGLLNRLLDIGFDETARNRLVEEARVTAMAMAKRFVAGMRPDVQNSARQTVEVLARGFGAAEVTVDFSDADLVEGAVESPAFAPALDKGPGEA